MRLRTFAPLMAALLLLAGPAGAAPAPAPVKEVPPAKPTLLRDDPLLQERVSLEATDRPLGDVLKELSPRLKVDLTASPAIADQRVTLHLTDQPVYLLMNRLPMLLSHLPARPPGYYWEKRDRPAKARPAFNLWRDLRSIQDEEYERDYPRREVAVMLRDMRNVIRMTPEQRAKYKSDYPPAPYLNDADPVQMALKGLPDEQIDALVDGQKIPLDPALFVKGIAAFKQKQRDYYALRKKQSDEYLRTHSPAGPVEPFVLEVPDVAPALSLRRMDKNGEDPDKATQYEIHLDGIGRLDSPGGEGAVSDEGVVLDVYDTSADRALDWVPLPAAVPKEPVIDLTPLLRGKLVTPEQRADTGFAIQALARAAHINVYQEHFLRRGATRGYAAPGPTPLKGTLPQLIAGICAEWNYHAEKVGEDYLFWSRTWAQDRAADVPDRLLSRWQARFKKQGGLTLDDHSEIAAALIWPQIVTLSQVLPEGCPADIHAYTMLRLLGQLSPAERKAAFSDNGLALASAPLQAQQELAADLQNQVKNVTDAVISAGFAEEYQKRIVDMTSDQLGQAVVRVETPPPGMREGVVGVNVQANGKRLFRAILGDFLPLAVPSPASSSPAAP